VDKKIDPLLAESKISSSTLYIVLPIEGRLSRPLEGVFESVFLNPKKQKAGNKIILPLCAIKTYPCMGCVTKRVAQSEGLRLFERLTQPMQE
jgi:hypothetical protein